MNASKRPTSYARSGFGISETGEHFSMSGSGQSDLGPTGLLP